MYCSSPFRGASVMKTFFLFSSSFLLRCLAALICPSIPVFFGAGAAKVTLFGLFLGLALLGDGFSTLFGLAPLYYGTPSIFPPPIFGMLKPIVFAPGVFLIIPLRAIDAALSFTLLSKIALAYPAGTLIETFFPV